VFFRIIQTQNGGSAGRREHGCVPARVAVADKEQVGQRPDQRCPLAYHVARFRRLDGSTRGSFLRTTDYSAHSWWRRVPQTDKINTNEPQTVAELAQAYELLATFPSRVPTMVFVLTTGPHKNGNVTVTQKDQNMKLWAQASADVDYPTSPFFFSHMNGAFLNKKKAKETISQVSRNSCETRVIIPNPHYKYLPINSNSMISVLKTVLCKSYKDPV